ncbi:PREDICTED: protein GUCD1 isoform X1 [Theobroma cacao]|uniref:Protein GUCD1 isoform X1 n=1 Tax=Theobroma cacao TaxID=3641 RepID=A0AB32X0Y8_THECC|nr:PREDICTED: protein GUCD1 isoform X1 [Theobroma cacao]XP_017985175.1 PREDICTED: protein GUCD1 isoform X1 [Theobroma cacao]
MWPLYFLLNKILKTDDEEKDGDHMNVGAGCCHFELSSDNRIGHDAVLPRSYFVQVPHINQLFSWDCGLACVLMALTTIGINDCSIQNLAELCCTTSIWTVDLAYLLQKFSVRFSYYTVTFGANPNYSGETYYKEQLPTDLLRVDMLFQKAVEAGINIRCRSISGEEISRWILSGKYIVIALVDQYKLSQSWAGDVIVPGLYGNDGGYTGHYVVICGYDAGADEFEIRDPASSRKHSKVSSKCLEEARKSFGTDEDLLLISLEESRKKQNYSVL